ncbi:methyl-accepting chemotaxis protein [Bacillus ectoiniformans]|uniref:methyl-accepting chemotaxis protein n=1 Tax=Bacillus ectoiniformans TaxID=1494429 RepID=UPI00195AD913|nr:methyl-accepting chemotaxis protein [Bacillus ectoiniformans]MBM7647378.1 methyl-accepting chemotaxis protein [Bacillus ectoiniformans]
MKKSKSISLKLSGLIIGLFLLLFMIYSIVTNVNLYKSSTTSTEKSTVEHTELYAAQIEKRFNQTNETLRTTKHIFESLNAEGELTASTTLNVIENNLKENPDIFGMAMILENGTVPIEPDVNKQLVDGNQRFVPYLYRDGENVKVEPLSDYEEDGSGDWYLIPRKENRAILTEPYEYQAGGSSVLMATISVPLSAEDGTFLGVITADFSIDFLNDLVKSMKPAGGYASIVTDQGFLVANSINQKLIGSNMKDSIDWKSIKSNLDNDKTSTLNVDSKQLKEEAFNAFAPVEVEEIKETWSVQTVVPQSTILQPFMTNLMMTITAAILMIILMSSVTFWFIHKQLKPLTYLRESLEMAASGDLTKVVNESHIREDEIGAVAVAFNDMLQKTSDVIHTAKGSSHQLNLSAQKVHDIFEEVVASSQEVSVAVDEIAQGASQQSEDTEDTNHQMVDLSEQIDFLSTISDEMYDLSQETAQSTKQGMEQVKLLREHNIATNDMNEKIQQQIQALSIKISDIDKVIESIHGITAQTNLLALNASIEAARAGEHGRGFAVVAEEVRKLAEQSSKETDIIQKTVQEILKEMSQTVSIITENIQLMEGQNQSVSDTESAFTHNAELAYNLGQSVSDLTAKLKDMIGYKEKAMLSIQSVSAISEQTAASAEQVSASASEQQRELERVAETTEQMNQIANELEEVVNRFTL